MNEAAKVAQIIALLEEEVRVRELELDNLKKALDQMRSVGGSTGARAESYTPLSSDPRRYNGLKIADAMQVWLSVIRRGATYAEIIDELKAGGCERVIKARYPLRSVSLTVANSGGRFRQKGLEYDGARRKGSANLQDVVYLPDLAPNELPEVSKES